jgi:hypothetical protein
MKRRGIELAHTRPGLAPAVLLLAAVSCGGEDATTFVTTSELGAIARPEPAAPAAADDGAELEGERIRTTRAADGSYASEVDATDMESWVYFSLETGAEVAPDVAEQSELWHLRIQRSSVKLNGGASGIGNVSVAIASEAFEAVVAAPEGEYLEDSGDEDMDSQPDYALQAGDGWYSYDPSSHLLTARETVFVLKTTGDFYKLQFLSYYDAAGTPGVPSFRWARLGGS